ncbi:HAD-IA family hydrolase [Rhodococcus kronopolitis]|uniref:HAD-IA family hydrolase n=1 Tax=Rhodococcus kronopolitis TaxID=1460226 RepID=A0ABV9FKE8_9NOCA
MDGLVVDCGGVLVGPGSDAAGLGEILAQVRRRGVRTAVLSNDPGGPGADWLRELGAGRLVDEVLLSGDVGLEKPDPRIYRLAAERLGLATADCVFVDDLPVNVRGAVAAGMVAVHHTDPERTVAELQILFGLTPGDGN